MEKKKKRKWYEEGGLEERNHQGQEGRGEEKFENKFVIDCEQENIDALEENEKYEKEENGKKKKEENDSKKKKKKPSKERFWGIGEKHLLYLWQEKHQNSLDDKERWEGQQKK